MFKNILQREASMRHSRHHKDRTRQRIVEAAGRLFAARGYAATSIEDIMRGCGLTRGAFYAYFGSKSALYGEAIDHVASRGELAGDATGRIGEDDWLESALGEDASSFAFLATDVASDEPGVRNACGRTFRALSERLRSCAGRPPRQEGAILSTLAMIIGALAVAQTTDDAELRRKLLASCRENARTLLDSAGAPLSYFWEPAAEFRCAM